LWLLPSGSDQVGEGTVRPTPGAAYGDMGGNWQGSVRQSLHISGNMKNADDAQIISVPAKYKRMATNDPAPIWLSPVELPRTDIGILAQPFSSLD
jgi:hypothetical protein